MKTVVNAIRVIGILVFSIAISLFLLTLLNYPLDFSDAAWLQIYFARLYIFFAVVGILAYILITFRRREE
ncbi:MAG TPA: hypothetical protein VK947_14195 [Planococcus sp. (in: firmicutes)]|nr:hypothetical protein [Planococcus sp. (in: firmicutes)]